MDNNIKDEKNYSFFAHKNCEYFPCHSFEDTENFNCLFCYCPLYLTGEECGGNFKYTKSGIKDCSDCTLPHRRDNYEYVINKFKSYCEKKGCWHKDGQN